MLWVTGIVIALNYIYRPANNLSKLLVIHMEIRVYVRYFIKTRVRATLRFPFVPNFSQ